MKAIQFNICGKYGHFKIPYTSNNPQTHSFITKTALIGMIGAVNDIDRLNMKRLFPLLSDNLKYCVHILNEIKKESLGFVMYNTVKNEKSPRYIEHLRNPNYNIILAFIGNDLECEGIFDSFCENIKNNISSYNTYLGLQNCPCDIKFISEGNIFKSEGVFETNGFISTSPILESVKNIKLFKEKIPTYQDDNWFNPPDKGINVYFTDQNVKIKTKSEYYIFNETNWYLC